MSSTGEWSTLTDQNLNIKATFMEVIDVVSSELKCQFNHHDIYKCVELSITPTDEQLPGLWEIGTTKRVWPNASVDSRTFSCKDVRFESVR